MGEPILLAGFTSSDLVDLKYHLDPEEFANSFIELVAKSRKGGNCL